MNSESAVDFPTPSRVHVALAVRDVDRAVAFYRALLDLEPTKLRPGYAKFEVLDPPLNLALNETPSATPPALPQHFGIQVKQHAAVSTISSRMREAGFPGEVEDQVTCCYAVQDKVWVTDPDGHRWEVYIVTEADAPVHTRTPKGAAAVAPCCSPGAEQAAAPPKPEQEPCCAPTCCS